ncbi:MAG: hypothetical protein ABR936_13475, partial [Bacteroidota bacterium]
KSLVNDILLSGRYLDAPISPMTLPMDQDTKIIITDSTYEALPTDLSTRLVAEPPINIVGKTSVR